MLYKVVNVCKGYKQVSWCTAMFETLGLDLDHGNGKWPDHGFALVHKSSGALLQDWSANDFTNTPNSKDFRSVN
jgi:hypothetical protein